jgi:parvulin-like peptidyl-prolyl isomerase
MGGNVVRCRGAAAVLLSVAAMLAGEAQAGDGDVIARAGTITVSSEDIRAYVATLDARTQAAMVSNPALLSQAVRTLLARQLVLDEALARKWDQQPAVAARLERVRQNATIELYLESVSTLPEGFPSEAKIQSTYDANNTAFLMPRQFRLAQIFIAAPADADKTTEGKARRKLDDVQKKLKQKGSDFGAIARASSDDQSTAMRGGEIDWLLEIQIKPEIRTAALGLAKDAVSEPLRLDDGWHVVKLLDTRPAHKRPLGEVRDQIVRQLRADSALESRKAYLAKLIEQNPPAVDELALAKVMGKPASPVAGQ